MIGFLRKLFKSPPGPNVAVKDEILGERRFNDDDEGWECQYKGIRILMAYEMESNPRNDLVMYCRQVLGDLDEYKESIRVVKERYVSQYKGYEEEVYHLKIQGISFNRHKGKPWFMVSFGTGNDYREWRTEFFGMSQDCQIGFDS